MEVVRDTPGKTIKGDAEGTRGQWGATEDFFLLIYTTVGVSILA